MSRFTIPITSHRYAQRSDESSTGLSSTCPDRDAGGLLGATARSGQLAVQVIGRERIVPRNDQPPLRPHRAGRLETGARHSPLPHDRMVATETEPRRPVPGRAFDCQMRRHPPTDHAESGDAATRLGERPDRNRPWAIIGQVELCCRHFPVFRHRRALSTVRARPASLDEPSVARGRDRSGHTPRWFFRRRIRPLYD